MKEQAAALLQMVSRFQRGGQHASAAAQRIEPIRTHAAPPPAAPAMLVAQPRNGAAANWTEF
jgi:hypothetical protein